MTKFTCCTWALAGADEEILTQIADVGFRWIDIRPGDFASDAGRAARQRLGLGVSCVGLSFGIPEGTTLGDEDADAASAALTSTKRSLDFAAAQGATVAYIVPNLDNSSASLARYANAVTALADYAAPKDIKLAIEHFPGRALPTIAGTLAFIRAIGHPNLYLLLDIGHAQMSNEDVPTAVADAGDRLAYVHLDDNDGINDLHWALCDGVWTEETLRNAFTALQESPYDGPLSLELNPTLPDPMNAIRRSWAIMEKLSQPQ